MSRLRVTLIVHEPAGPTLFDHTLPAGEYRATVASISSVGSGIQDITLARLEEVERRQDEGHSAEPGR